MSSPRRIRFVSAWASFSVWIFPTSAAMLFPRSLSKVTPACFSWLWIFCATLLRPSWSCSSWRPSITLRVRWAARLRSSASLRALSRSCCSFRLLFLPACSPSRPASSSFRPLRTFWFQPSDPSVSISFWRCSTRSSMGFSSSPMNSPNFFPQEIRAGSASVKLSASSAIASAFLQHGRGHIRAQDRAEIGEPVLRLLRAAQQGLLDHDAELVRPLAHPIEALGAVVEGIHPIPTGAPEGRSGESGPSGSHRFRRRRPGPACRAPRP